MCGVEGGGGKGGEEVGFDDVVTPEPGTGAC